MKKIKSRRGFSIYERSDAELSRILLGSGMYASRFEVFLPDESPSAFNAPEWEADNLQECTDFIDCYDSEE